MPVKYKFIMRGPRRCRRRCLSFLLFIPCLKFPLTIRIYVSAPRAMKHGPCITHHGSQEQPFCVAYSRTMASSDLFFYLSVHESQSRHCPSARSSRSKNFNIELREVIFGAHLRKHLRKCLRLRNFRHRKSRHA